MDWDRFKENVYIELSKGKPFFDFRGPFRDEHQLTAEIVLGLRKLFSSSYRKKRNSIDLHYHVVYRKGDSIHDKRAWKQAKSEKWIFFHGVRFVPDILVFENLNASRKVLPIEVKLIKRPGASQSIATAIGQSLIYNLTYPESLSFVGVKNSIKWGKYQLLTSANAEDNRLHTRLSRNKIRLVLKNVG